MKPWRRTRDNDGTSRLFEVTSPTQVDRTSLIISLPGVEVSHQGLGLEPVAGARIAGMSKTIEGLLGSESPNPTVEILSLSYDDNALANLNTIITANGATDYTNAEARDFVDRYLYPWIEAKKTITLFACSFGAVFAEMTRAALIHKYKQQGFSEKAIGEKLQNIVLVAVANVSNAIDPDIAGRNSQLDYTAAFFMSPDDQASRSFVLFNRQIPLSHKPGGVSIRKLTGNRALVIINTPAAGWVWKRRKGVPELVRYDDELGAHRLGFFTIRNPGTSHGAVEALEQVLRNAATRTGQPGDVLELIGTPANKVPPPKKETWSRNSDLPPGYPTIRHAINTAGEIVDTGSERRRRHGI